MPSLSQMQQKKEYVNKLNGSLNGISEKLVFCYFRERLLKSAGIPTSSNGLQGGAICQHVTKQPSSQTSMSPSIEESLLYAISKYTHSTL